MRSPLGRLSVIVLLAAAVYCGALVALSRQVPTYVPPASPTPRPISADPSKPPPDNNQTYQVEIKEYVSPPHRPDEFIDDELDEQRVPAFDPALVHSEPAEGWELNLSSAVIRLDTPQMRPDFDAELMKLHPSYHAALETLPRGMHVLPSVSLLDGKAKQFDDGLYAALDLAYYSGLDGALQSHVDFIRKLAMELGPDSPVTPFLAAGLELVDVPCEVTDVAARDQFLRDFQANPHFSKPVGFYNWRPELQRCFRFLRFFQQEFDAGNPGKNPAGANSKILQPIADLLNQNDELQRRYRSIIAFYSRLTNPPISQTLLDLIGQSAASSRVSRNTIAVIPSSTSRETVLFERMFPQGLPPDVDLMQTLIHAIRSGGIDLKPDEQSGWYDYQVYALETLLLPARSEESVKLLLTANYKRRMLEAFAAMITKRRETHVRQLAGADMPTAEPPQELMHLKPSLRVEPLCTYYLRTARAYAFLQQFLHSTIGRDHLATLHRLRQEGELSQNLADELESQRLLFYGLYLLAAEDIGLATHLPEQELAEPQSARERAQGFLAEFRDDPDLAADTRVIVPVGYDSVGHRLHLWMTVGVRFARLNAQFDGRHRPSIRPVGGMAWTEVNPEILQPSENVIAVDEFATVTIPTLNPPTREEFRRLCDQSQSKEEILQKLVDAARP